MMGLSCPSAWDSSGWPEATLGMLEGKGGGEGRRGGGGGSQGSFQDFYGGDCPNPFIYHKCQMEGEDEDDDDEHR